MTSIDNLKKAFAGESQANRKYLAFAKQAEQEKLFQVAKLFRAVADAETIHAHAHLKVMGGVNKTQENLKEAISGENHEFKTMYPEFLELAQKEGNKKAEVSFRNAMKAEEVHHGQYINALKAIEKGNDLPQTPLYLCPVCGNVVEGQATDKCPICNVPGNKFVEVV